MSDTPTEQTPETAKAEIQEKDVVTRKVSINKVTSSTRPISTPKTLPKKKTTGTVSQEQDESNTAPKVTAKPKVQAASKPSTKITAKPKPQPAKQITEAEQEPISNVVQLEVSHQASKASTSQSISAVETVEKVTAKVKEVQDEVASKIDEAITHSVSTTTELTNTAPVPEALRSIAQQTLTNTKNVYEKTKDVVEEVSETFDDLIDKASQNTQTFNEKIYNLTQENLNRGFDHTKQIFAAKDIAEAMEIQNKYVRENLEIVSGQVKELQELSSQLTADVTEPIKQHVTKSFERLNDQK